VNKSDNFYYIDFEGSFTLDNDLIKIKTNISIEVAKLVRWATRDLGAHHLNAVLECMMIAYGKTSIPDLIVNRVCNKPFQFIHRWKDKKKKEKNAADVTKYDIADAIKQLKAAKQSSI